MQKERAHREKVEDKHVNGSFRVRWHSICAGSHNIFSISAGEICSTEYINQKKITIQNCSSTAEIELKLNTRRKSRFFIDYTENVEIETV